MLNKVDMYAAHASHRERWTSSAAARIAPNQGLHEPRSGFPVHATWCSGAKNGVSMEQDEASGAWKEGRGKWKGREEREGFLAANNTRAGRLLPAARPLPLPNRHRRWPPFLAFGR